METRMMVSRDSELQEIAIPDHQPQNKVVRFVAKLLSYIFHPLFVPVYMIWFLLSTQPYMFAQFSPADKAIALLRFFYHL